MENCFRNHFLIDFIELNIMESVKKPKIRPDTISALFLVLSIFFVFYNNILYQILMLTIVLLLDRLDDSIAKKYQYGTNRAEKEKRWMVGAFSDRLSEGIVSIIYFMPFFFLFSLNCFLSLWSYKSKKHFILPVRQILLVYLIVKFFIN